MPAPLSPPPASDKGAFTIPRMLQRWLDVHPVTKLTRTQAYVTLPSFSVTPTWVGVSDIVVAFNFEGPNNFSLTGFDVEPFPTPNYMLCVMWKDKLNNVHRYKLWEEVGEVFYINCPIYSGQKIAKNFRFEIWSTNNSPITQATPIQIFTSVLGGVDWRYGQDFTLISSDTAVTNFFNINSPRQLPITNIDFHWMSTNRLVKDGSNNFVSWTDTIVGLVLNPTSLVGVVNDTIIAQPSVQFLVNGASISANLTGNTELATAITFKMNDLGTSGTIYDDGGGNTIQFNHTTSTISAFNGGGLTFSVTTGVWYLAVLNATFGFISLYNLQTGQLIGAGNNFSSTGPSGTLTIGTIQCSVAEVVAYTTNLSNDDFIALLAYFTQTYSLAAYSLPLEFPLNSSPQPN